MKNRVVVLSVLALLAISVFSCRGEEDTAVQVDKIQFEVSKKEMYEGEKASIRLTINPKEVKRRVSVEYSASKQGIIAIDTEKSSNEGVVFEAIKAGSVVLMARCNGLVEYCDIKIEGDPEAAVPYISLTDYVIEMKLGTKRHVVASLQGGNQADLINFTFSTRDDAVNIETANNTVVIDGVKTGNARITAKHPRAQYTVDIVVFVLNEGEAAKYITGENVVFMQMGQGPRNYSVRMAGLQASEAGYCIYQAVEGTDVVTVKGSGDSCTIEAKRPGIAKVEVINQGVQYPFYFQVVVRGSDEVKYISVPTNFMIIEGVDFYTIGASMVGEVPEDFPMYYTCKLSKDDIVSVDQTRGSFALKGLKEGSVIMTISNRYSEFDQQILIVVQNLGGEAATAAKFIRTSQNVIQVDIGKDAADAVLKMELVGGTSADQNDFVWVVEDSSVIDVYASGKVSYTRAQTNQGYEAQAIISAKRVGTTRINISNKKALNDISVIVKVYPKGTFSGTAIYLSGQSLIRVQEGKSVEVFPQIVGGSGAALGTTNWSAADSSIAQAAGSGLTGSITGRKSGVTRVKVSGMNIAQDYDAVVVVFREGQEDKIQYAYTDNLHYTITVGQTINIPVRHPNIVDDKFSFTVVNSNKNAIYHVISKDMLLVNGLKEGSSELVITTTPGECNNITLYINVEPSELVIDKPYSLTGNNFAGTQVDGTAAYTVVMAGANAGKLNGIVYSIDDEKTAKIKGSAGNKIEIQGLAKGQTVLRINHSESMNEKAVIVYVTEKGQSVEGKIILGLEKYNYIMSVNESLFIRLVTNATDEQKQGIKWKTGNADKVYVEDNYDTAVITAREPGNAKVTVYEKDNKHLIDLDIFITIKETTNANTGQIGFPDSIILIKNENKVMKGNIIGQTTENLDLAYTFENEGIASITPQGLEILFKGESAGQTFLTVTSAKISYYKKILVICVNTEEEAEKLYYFTVDKMLYRIKKNEQVKIAVAFGENGFPEAEKALIEWSEKNGNQTVVIASPRGPSNTIVGKNEGQAVIQIKSALMAKPVEVIVEIVEEAAGSDFYKFIYTPINQFTRDKTEMIPISIYYGNQFYSDYDIYKPGIKLEQGYTAIKVEVEDASVADAQMVGQNLRVSTRKAGKTTVTLSHEMINEDARLLIVVYDGVVPPESSDLVIFVPKVHWLILQGESKEIALESNANSPSGLSGVVWNNRNKELFSVDAADKTKAVVTGIKEGSGTITIEQGGKTIETVYVSVSQGAIAQASVATESIIILSMTDMQYGPYRTKIISSGNIGNIQNWNVKDDKIVKITPLGSYCDLTPLKAGLTELTIDGINFSRTIIVKIVNTEAEKMAAKVMNLDQRYYRIKKDETVVLTPYYKASRSAYPVSAALVYGNKVIKTAQTSGGISITGNNVGIEKIRFYNEDCENKNFEVEIEVNEDISGGFDAARNLVYMTTEQPVIMIKPGEANYYTRLEVIGQYRGGEDDFKWASNSGKVSVSAFGTYAFITTGNQEGEAEITVTNRFCEGLPLKIKVIVTADITMSGSGSPYLYAGKNVYTMQRGDPDLVIPLELRGLSPVYWNYVEMTTKGTAVRASFTNGNITVKEINTGTGEITIKYRNIDTPLVLYIVVNDQYKAGSSYLTTSQNYIIVNKFSTVYINVNLVNYTEPDSTKFSWHSEDPSIAYIVGNGQAVQILGMEPGVTKVVVKHPVSFNTLDIIVKVIPPGNSESVCYLTTGDNVLETYISAVQGQIAVQKVGGTTNVINAAWSVDDPSIVSVLGNNDVGYYTARKEGVARITVTDKEAGTLSIVVIVRKGKPGGQYLFTDSPIVQVTPNSSNNTIKVELSDAEEQDEMNFRWEIYTQLPGSLEVARNGGSVLGIYAMGSRCSVNGIYAGTARLKVTHPKAAEALFILVQVTHFKTMRFTQESIEMEADDMMFAALETPDYEDYTGRVKYITDNPSVCTAYGTSKAVLLSSFMAGRAKVTAYVEDSDLIAEIEINVLAEKNYEQPYIITPRTTFMLNPRELPFFVEAQMYGVGVNEQDWDSLLWEVKNDTAGIIKIYPENNNKAGTSVGRSIQVVVQNKPYTGMENCVIEISCPHLTNRIKTIYLQVSEDSNAFSLTKYDMTMQSNDMAEINCNILGGKTRDYDEVVWMAEPDSYDPTKEIVRVMGNGKTVHLLAINDGMTQLTAVYRGMIRICQVKVKSSVFIGIQYQNFLTFPGERKNDKTLITINYEVRPVNAFIQWMDTDTDINNKIAMVSYTAAKDDGTGTGRGLIMLDPLREGQFSIVAVSNQKNARVNIIVKNDFQFRLDRYEIDETPASSTLNKRGQPKTPADTTVNYTVSPANVKIEPMNYSYIKLKEMGVSFVVSPAERVGNEALKGVGTIYFICENEINIDLQLQITQADGRPAGKDVIIKLIATFPPGEGRLVPVYEPVYGYLTTTGKTKYPIASQAGKTTGNPLTGSMYKAGYYLKPVQVQTNISSGKFENDIYEVEIGDGSTQYILIDHINPKAMAEMSDDIKINKLGTLGGLTTTDANGNIITRDITVKKEMRENGEMAIRIDGGKDFIIYSNYGTEFKLVGTINTPDPDAGDAYQPLSGSPVSASAASPKTQTGHSGSSNSASESYTYSVPYANGGTFSVSQYISRHKNNDGDWVTDSTTWSPSGTVCYSYPSVLLNRPTSETVWFNRQTAQEKQGNLAQSSAWEFRKLLPETTRLYLLTGKYDGGNIRLNKKWNYHSDECFDFAPVILYEGYERPFRRVHSSAVSAWAYEPGGAYPVYVSFAYFHQKGSNPYWYFHNYIYHARTEFTEYVNVFLKNANRFHSYYGDTSIISLTNPRVFGGGDQLFKDYVWNQEYHDWDYVNNTFDSQRNPKMIHFTIDSMYEKIDNKDTYESHSVFDIGPKTTGTNTLSFVAFNPSKPNGEPKTFYKWTKTGSSQDIVVEKPVGMVHIFKERYDKANPSKPIDPWALSGTDKQINDSNDFTAYPYRYFPLPATEDYKGQQNPYGSDPIDLVSLKPVDLSVNPNGSNYAAEIIITYKNVYSNSNQITIRLKHRISPAHTDNENIKAVPPKIANSWDETVEKSWDEIFPAGSPQDAIKQPTIRREGWPVFYDRLRIPKNY